jgi:ADP-ribose pyrophosphatase
MHKEECLLKCDRFRVVRARRVDPNGVEQERAVIRHPGAVTILPFVDEHHLCLIKNYRISVDRVLVELPAGTLEAGEDPALTAERELAEETGYRARRWRRLQEFYLSPGILDERMHVFAAEDLQSGPPAREAGESIENWVVSWSVALDMIRRGEIQDAKTIVALLAYQLQDSI